MQPGTLHEVYEFLQSLDRDRASPADALARLARTRRTAELADLDVVWERSAFDGSLHFDALLPSEAGTLSMSWCPDRGVPWPLRGVQRNSEADLVRVDGYTLKIPTAIALMDLVWSNDDLLTRLIDAAILHKQQDVLGLSITEVGDDELQHEIDEFRRARELFTPEATERWLAEHGLDLARLEGILADRRVRRLIRDRVIAPRIEARLADTAPFDRVALEWLSAADAAQALALYVRVQDGEVSLAYEARRRFAAGGPPPEPYVRLWRRDLPPAVADLLFGTPAGELAPPFELGGRHRVARVVAVEPARAGDPAIGERIREACFAEWLSERRAAADIEWFWGFDAEAA